MWVLVYILQVSVLWIGYATALNDTTTESPMVTISDGSYCQGNWKRHEQSCYKRMTDQLDFPQANASCNENGHLVSISDKDENKFVMSLSNSTDDAWIGLYHQTDNCMNHSLCDWMWTDGSKLGYINWQPKAVAAFPKCAVFGSNGIWNNNQPCNGMLDFICERSVWFRTTTHGLKADITTDIKSCLIGWISFNFSCYLLMNKGLNFSAAKKACYTNGGHVLSIPDVQVNMFINKMSPSGVWIGLWRTRKDDCTVDECTTSVRRQGWEWLDGTPVTYTKWNDAEFEPDGNSRCVSMDSRSLWRDTDCSELLPVICAYSLDTRGHDTITTTTADERDQTDVGLSDTAKGIIVTLTILATASVIISIVFVSRRMRAPRTTTSASETEDVTQDSENNDDVQQTVLSPCPASVTQTPLASDIYMNGLADNHVDLHSRDGKDQPAYGEMVSYTEMNPAHQYTCLQMTHTADVLDSNLHGYANVM